MPIQCNGVDKNAANLYKLNESVFAVIGDAWKKLNR
jgi:hypothetical protein